MLLLINAVGLTQRLLASAPRLTQLAREGWVRPLHETIPAVTCSAQATMLTGCTPEQHGIVGNGWLYRDTMEVRFWQQSNYLIEAEPLYVTARRRAARRGQEFHCAKLFWWFNQGADVSISVTPKPHYGVDGNKVFGITGTPIGFPEMLEQKLGSFPFSSFWGPMAGIRSTQWIAKAGATVLRENRPDLTLVYLPHLDYDPQRFGPAGCDMSRQVRALDDACAPLLDAARTVGASVWVVSEYGHCDVNMPVYLNRLLRTAGMLSVREGPFGEQLDIFGSRAFAVCDHQLAHIYVPDPGDFPKVHQVFARLPGIARLLQGEERADIGLRHQRAGDIIALAEPWAWFAYPFWGEDRNAPDYARTVAIHHKPGYDPCELFFNPKLPMVKARAALRLLQKTLGFRMKMDVVPLDAAIVRGSHGLRAAKPEDRPVLIGAGPAPPNELPMTAVRDLLLRELNLETE